MKFFRLKTNKQTNKTKDYYKTHIDSPEFPQSWAAAANLHFSPAAEAFNDATAGHTSLHGFCRLTASLTHVSNLNILHAMLRCVQFCGQIFKRSYDNLKIILWY